VQLGERDHRLSALDARFGITLDLKPAKPPVIHGRDGISQKAEGAGHASHYISFTRLLTSGSVDLDGATYQVEGTSWMDHEFFSQSLGANESGWDWLSLQFNDNTELMLYRLRHKDGSVDPYSSGTFIDAQGKGRFLSSKDFTMTPADETWTSSQTKATYPLRWHVAVPGLALQADITTSLASQELAGSIGPSYWEGAIDVTGQRTGVPLRGVGYLEMVGYGTATGPSILPQ
jgi:predicted secreted hydrolase